MQKCGRKRYAIVGMGDRASVYRNALLNHFQENSQLVGLCDSSQTRMDWHNRQLTEGGHCHRPTFLDHDFDRLIDETNPNCVIVATTDNTHHHYIIRAMEKGCDVITEKPMTTNAANLRSILKSVDETGKDLRVTFNYRYNPVVQQIQKLIQNGQIGRPLHVNFSWLLDTSHGADYFRRWHRDKETSGGLLIHKASHHFDMVNWWLNSKPDTVQAMGNLSFYGEQKDSQICDASSFELDIESNPTLRGLYKEAETETGYIRNNNVFGQGISAEDTLSVSARYETGTLLTYSLIAYAPYEGFRISITGDRGRLEWDMKGRLGRSKVACQHEESATSKLQFIPHFGDTVLLNNELGDAQTTDHHLMHDLFSSTPEKSLANHMDGATSVALGIAANQSIDTGETIRISNILNA